MPILDQYGEPIKAGKPAKGFAYVTKAKDRLYVTSIKGLTPDRVWAAFNQAYDGNVSPIQALFEQAIRHDGRLYNFDQRRRGGVAGLEQELRPYVEQPSYGEEAGDPEPKDVELRDKVHEVLYGIPNYQDVVKGIADGIGKGYSVHGINWVTDSDYTRPYLRFIPQRKFTFLRRDPEEQVLSDWPNIITDNEMVYGEELDQNRYLVAIYRDSGEPWRCGVMWPCMWWYLRKHEAWSQLMATGERFAEPSLLAYVGTQDMNSTLVQTTREALEDLGPGTSVIVPGSGGPIKYEEGNTHGAYLQPTQMDLRIPKDFWMAGIEDCDREMGIAWSGGNLLSDTTGGTGTHAAYTGQRQSEMEDIRAHDAEWLSTGALDRLIELICLHNWGEEAAARRPTIAWPDLEPVEDQKTKAETYKLLGETDWEALKGLPEAVRDDMGIPEMGDPEETDLEEPAPAGEPGQEPAQVEPEEPMAPEVEEATPEQRAQQIVEHAHARCCHHYSLAGAVVEQAKLQKVIAGVLGKIDPYNISTANDIAEQVVRYRLKMTTPPKSAAAFRDHVMRIMDKDYAKMAAQMQARGLGTWFEQTYKHYKTTDLSVFGPAGPPAGTEKAVVAFGLPDKAVMNHMAKSTHLYFSKFTQNETFRGPMEKYLNAVYNEHGAQLFKRNPEVVKGFGKVLGKTTKKLASYEVDRIARTTIARAREDARIIQLNDAGVKQAVVQTHPDACEICAPYEGKTVDVGAEVKYIEHMSTLTGKAWEKAARKHTQNAINKVPPHEFAMGASGPIWHPNCRCEVVMKF